jgi:hypothetical protein
MLNQIYSIFLYFKKLNSSNVNLKSLKNDGKSNQTVDPSA